MVRMAARQGSAVDRALPELPKAVVREALAMQGWARQHCRDGVRLGMCRRVGGERWAGAAGSGIPT